MRMLVLSALCVLGSVSSLALDRISPLLIRGNPVPAGTWLEVVRIQTQLPRGASSMCTATIVGPKVIVTAAHCVTPSSRVSTFSFKGKTYTANVTRSSLYPGRDHDIAVGITTEEISGAVPHTIGGAYALNKEVTLLGYGCTISNGNGTGSGGNDGILRIGKNILIGTSGFDMVSRTPSGSALCSGDSGGPAFLQEGDKFLLLGINSKGDMIDTNYNARLDRTESTTFLQQFAQQNSVDICGINKQCGTTGPNPSCTLTASPKSLKVGETVSLILSSQNATIGDIDGTPVNPNGEKRVTTTGTGSFTSTATVKNAAGASATCSDTYTVTNDPVQGPGCSLTAVPNVAKPGETISLELQATGNVTFASIDGTAVSFPLGKFNVTRTNKGDYGAIGFVRGPGGVANCFAEYTIRDGVGPELPEFAIAPTHCGKNRYPQSGVKSACVAVVKQDSTWTEFKVPLAVLITYTNDTQDILPLVARQPVAGTPSKDDFALYQNASTKGQNYPILEVISSMMTKGTNDVPLSIEGRVLQGAQKRYFIVDQLSAFMVHEHLPVAKPDPLPKI